MSNKNASNCPKEKFNHMQEYRNRIKGEVTYNSYSSKSAFVLTRMEMKKLEMYSDDAKDESV